MRAKRRVVVLDDDVLFLSSLVRAIDRDIEVTTFESPSACIEHVLSEQAAIDLVCVGLHMADKTGVAWQLGGLHTIQTLRHGRRGARPTLCALTGLDAVIHIHTCLKNGADGFVEKASDVDIVARSIMARLGEPVG